MAKEFEVEEMYITVYNHNETADMFSEQLSEEYYDDCMDLLWTAYEENDKGAAEELNEKISEMGGVYYLKIRIGAPVSLKRSYDEDEDNDEINNLEEKIRAELLERLDKEEAEMIIEALKNLDEDEADGEEITSILIIDTGTPIYYYEGEGLGYGDRGCTQWVAQYRTVDNEIAYERNLEVDVW